MSEKRNFLIIKDFDEKITKHTKKKFSSIFERKISQKKNIDEKNWEKKNLSSKKIHSKKKFILKKIETSKKLKLWNKNVD